MKKISLITVVSILFSLFAYTSVAFAAQNQNTEIKENQISSTQNTKEPDSSKIDDSQTNKTDYSIPQEFIDYRKFIGKDISSLNVDTSTWNTDDYSHELWRGSFFEHYGIITVHLGWDNKTIIEFFLRLDDTDKFSDSDRENFDSILQDIFGSNVEEMNISYNYSGKGDYEFQFPKLLDQTSVCALSWNTDTMLAYMNTKPQEEETPSKDTQIIEKIEPAIGMTSDEVKKSTWGEPSDINKTTTKYGIHEQWVYKSPVKNKYIYFEDGLVTAIQE